MDGKQTLNEKPITQDNSNLDSIWDIDEPSFDEAFQIETDKGDPLAGLPTTEEKPEEAPAPQVGRAIMALEGFFRLLKVS